MEKSEQKVATLPYAERRVIAILPSSETEAASSAVDWKAVAGLGAGVFGINILGAVVPFLFGGPLLPASVGAYLAKKYLGSGKPNSGRAALNGVLAVDYASAIQQLRFPPGHPAIDHSYVGHPLVSERYIPYAAFHPVLFEEKVNELITLLASLGATRVRVACRKGYRQSSGINFGVGGPKGSPNVGVDASAKSSARDEAVFEEHFRPSGSPRVSEDLVWLGHEASWQALAERRLRFGTSKFQVSLRFEDDFGISAKLKADLEGLGIKLGGNFSAFESTEWEFEGEFA
jgi:hypothetical protein